MDLHGFNGQARRVDTTVARTDAFASCDVAGYLDVGAKQMVGQCEE